MTKNILIALVFFVSFNVAGFGQKEKEQIKMKTSISSSNSVEYKLIILDAGFESWYVTKQAEQHSHDFYRSRNIQYVTEWNSRFIAPGNYNGLFTSRIDYDPSVKYPMELDSKLYWYFIYFEEANHTKLLPYTDN